MGASRTEAGVSSEHVDRGRPSDFVSTEELARRQGIGPARSVDELTRPGVVSPEELAEFHRLVTALRHDATA